MVKWHVFSEVKPPVSVRVLVVRKSAFSAVWYVDIAKWDGEKWRAGGAVISVNYWAELPEVPNDE